MRWRFVDKILSFSPWEAITALKAGSFEEYSLLERWGDLGETPSILSLESAIEAGRCLVEASSGFKHSFDVCEIENWKADVNLRPSERLYSSLKIFEKQDEHIVFNVCQKRLNPSENLKSIVDFFHLERAFSITAKFAPLAERTLPEDRQALWGEMTAND